MPYYRIITNLSAGMKVIRHGTIQRLDYPQKSIDRLIEVGAISRISTPPLDILPGWEERAHQLKPLGIITIEDFFEALDDKPDEITRLFEKESSEVIQWRKELEHDWLVIAR